MFVCMVNVYVSCICMYDECGVCVMNVYILCVFVCMMNVWCVCVCDECVVYGVCVVCVWKEAACLLAEL